MNLHAAISEADERALLDSIDRWLVKKVAPVAAKYEQADEYPHELVRDMCEMGLYGALIEPEFGGLGLSASTYVKIVSRISGRPAASPRHDHAHHPDAGSRHRHGPAWD
jgi:alkylation response protein AidB-like acyl-CoA dehydrogenase